MENASKALFIGVSILIAIGIIGLATTLFNSASQVTETYYSKELSDELNTFNSNFTKYIGAIRNEASGAEQKYATIYDVISVANFAWDYNVKAVEDPTAPELQSGSSGSEWRRILHVNIGTSDKSNIIKDLQNYDQQTFYSLMQDCYYIGGDAKPENIMDFEIDIVETNDDGRINTVTFYPTGRGIDGQLETIFEL